VKLEIKLIVVHAGLSVQSKQWVTEPVLLVNKWNKIEFQQKIWILAAVVVEWDAMEDILQLLGIGGPELELLLELYIKILCGAKLILWNLVIITLQENMDLAQQLDQLLHAKKHVYLDTKHHMSKTNTKEKPLIMYLEQLIKLPLKSWPMVL